MSTDRRTVQLVVALLGLIAMAIIVGAVYLLAVGRVVPDAFWTLAGGALGALAALLAKTSTEPSPMATLEALPIAPVRTAEAPSPSP